MVSGSNRSPDDMATQATRNTSADRTNSELRRLNCRNRSRTALPSTVLGGFISDGPASRPSGAVRQKYGCVIGRAQQHSRTSEIPLHVAYALEGFLRYN
jgi:hypothetical protein